MGERVPTVGVNIEAFRESPGWMRSPRTKQELADDNDLNSASLH